MPAVIYRLWFLLCLFAGNAAAQLCTGPAADPVVVIDFGNADQPYNATGRLGRQYTVTTETCTPEGAIALRPKAFMCKPEWVVVASDHTAGDASGNFLMVNSLAGTTEVFRDTIRNLCPGTVYNTEAWMINLLEKSACNGRGADPVLLFEITDIAGNALQSYRTGNVRATTQAEWFVEHFQFLSPQSGNVIIKIYSLNAESCGGDFGIDDISFAACKAGIQATLQPSNEQSLQVCEENQQAYLLSSSYAGFNNAFVQWQVSENGSRWMDINGATGNTYQRGPTSSGDYNYRLRLTENNNPACTFTSNVVMVQIAPQPFAQSTNYVFGCYGSPVTFHGAGGSNYIWKGPKGFSSTEQMPTIPKVDFSHTGQYIVQVTNGAGCTASDSVDLIVRSAPVAQINTRDVKLCAGDSVQLLAGGSLGYLWLPAQGLSSDTIANPVAKPVKTTTYTVQVFNEYTCFDTATVSIQVTARPAVNAGPDKYILKNRPVLLEGQVTGPYKEFRWLPADRLNNPRILRPLAKLTQTTFLRLEAEALNGCGIVSDEVKVEVIDGLFIPTAFSPNGDRLNDIWEIVSLSEYPAAEIKVFNRWGQIVYQSTGSDYQPWNGYFKGVPVTPGLYIYQLNLGNGSPLQKGTLMILQ